MHYMLIANKSANYIVYVMYADYKLFISTVIVLLAFTFSTFNYLLFLL